MHTIIVPLDFSETSFNAAEFAVNMYSNRKDVKLIFYHFYEQGDNIDTAKTFTSSLVERLSDKGVQLESYIESGNNFIDAISAYAHVQKAFMIILGLTGKTPLEQRFSGSNTLKLVERNVAPVLVIPVHAKYRKMENVMIASEMKIREETPALLAVKRVLEDFKPHVHILNVDSSHYISLTEDFKDSRDKMADMLAEFQPEFYFMRLFDFHESVNLFTRDKDIDLIIIAPKQRSFYERLFKTQHTKTLIYQSEVPVLAVQD